MLAHIHIMKTAGQTVCDILRKSLSPCHCDLRAGNLANADDVRFAKSFYTTLHSIAGHAIRPVGDLVTVPEIRFFAFLREPSARCISHYQFERCRNKRRIDFLPWLEKYSDYQTRVLTGTRDPERAIETLRQHVEFVGLVEDFDRSLDLLRNWSGYNLNTAYRSRNIAKNTSIRQEITSNPVFVRALHEANAADRVLYEHVTTTVYPKLVDEYAGSNNDLLIRTQRPVTFGIWSAAKRNLIYKPLAKTRQRFRHAA